MENKKSDKDVLVGIYYFSGWWRQMPNKYTIDGKDWRDDFSSRVAILGEYDDQETMDSEIIAAANHGVDYFQILWYPPSEKDETYPLLDSGVSRFMASPNNGMMKFSVEYVNHPPFDIESNEQWIETCHEWCRWMKHPSYLRVNSKPVFKIHGLSLFLQQCGGNPKKAKEKIGLLRAISGQHNLPNPLISAGIVMGERPPREVTAPYDFITTYMDMPLLPVKAEPYPYADLIDFAENGWKTYSDYLNIPYLPYVPSGWDPRPWKDSRPAFNLPNKDEWTDALKRVKKMLDEEKNLGIPYGNQKIQKSILIYAWNEFGEGGICAPTQGDGYMKLEAIREVFGG